MSKPIFYTLLYLVASLPLFSQTRELDLAHVKELSYKKAYVLADSILGRLHANDPSDFEVRMMMGYNQSWWGNHENAIKIFKDLIRDHKDNIEALLGLGYSYSYAGAHANAYYPFTQILALDKENEEAKKGLAYNFFYQSNFSAAEKKFKELHDLFPHKEEYTLALAKIYLAQNRLRQSLQEAEKVLTINPRSTEALEIRSKSRREIAQIELNAYVGSAFSNNKVSFGMRLLQINYRKGNKYTIGLKIDNSLSTDNIFLYSKSVFTPTLWLGAGKPFGKHSYVNIEVGNRFLDGNTLFSRGEYLYFTNSNVVFKTGYYSDLSPNTKEYNFRVGIDYPLAKRMRLGSTYFYGKESATSAFTYRWLFTTSVEILKVGTIDFGYFFGNNGMADKELQQKSINGFYSIAQIPLSNKVALMIIGSYENGVFNNTLVTSIGGKMKFF